MTPPPDARSATLAAVREALTLCAARCCDCRSGLPLDETGLRHIVTEKHTSVCTAPKAKEALAALDALEPMRMPLDIHADPWRHSEADRRDGEP